MMHTRCPACQTIFRVRPEQLRARHGQVRCGHCFAIFDALQHLQENGTQPSPTAEANAASSASAPDATVPRGDAAPAEHASPLSSAGRVAPPPGGSADDGFFFILEDKTPAEPSPAADTAPAVSPPPAADDAFTIALDDDLGSDLDFEVPAHWPGSITEATEPGEAAEADTALGDTGSEAPDRRPNEIQLEPFFPDADFLPADERRTEDNGASSGLYLEPTLPPFPPLEAPGGHAETASAILQPPAPAEPIAPSTPLVVTATITPIEGGAPTEMPSSDGPDGTPARTEHEFRSPQRDAADDEADDETEALRLDAAYGPRPGAARPGLWAVGVGLLLGALAVQGAFLFRDEITRALPQLRPAYLAVCERFGCALTLPHEAALISIESSDLEVDPVRKSDFVLNAVVRNRAAYPQAFPHLELTLTDALDRPIVRRVLTPEEWLRSPPGPNGFGAGAEIALRLPFGAPGINAVGYRVYVFYP